MKAYEVTGEFKIGRRNAKFKKQVACNSPVEAKELVYKLIGSNHKIKRRFIKIMDIREISADEVVDGVVKFKLGLYKKST